MTSTERHAHRRRRRRKLIAAALVTTTLTACAQDPPKPKPLTAGTLDDRDFIRLRAAGGGHVVTPKPPRAKKRQTTEKPASHALGTLRVTAYCYTGSRTSTGTWPHRGTAAVKAATGIPYGARLRIAGVSYLVTDREPPWGVSDVDLYEGWRSDCERWANRFGIRHLRVERAA